MALDILSEPSKVGDDDDIVVQMEEAIRGAIPDGRIEVRSISPGHFEIDVVSPAFEGKSRVKQQQLVYGAIASLMAGDSAPVHAIDRLTTRIE
jgi:stress-induced morphogen